MAVKRRALSGGGLSEAATPSSTGRDEIFASTPAAALGRRVLFNTTVQIAGKLVILASTLAIVRMTTAYLGVAGYGRYAIVLALIPIFFAVADLGIPTLLARELAKTPRRRDELGGTLFAFRLFGSTAALAACAGAVFFFPYDRQVKMSVAIASAGVLALSLAAFATPYFQVNLRLDLQALVDVAGALLSVTLIALATVFDLGLYAVVGATAAASFGVLVLALRLSRRFWNPNVTVDRALARPLARDALPIAGVSVFGLLHFKLDAVLLSLLKPAADVGIYTVAYRFLEQSLVFPVVFMGAVFPILTTAVNRRSSEAAAIIERSFSFLLLLAVPLAILTAALAEPLVHLVATNSFDASVTPLRILAVALVFTFASATFANLLLALNRQTVLVAISLAGIVVNVTLNLYFIPRYSYTGAAITTVISEGAAFAAVLVVARRSSTFSIQRGFLLRLSAAAAVMLALLLVLERPFPFWVAALAAAVGFAAAAYVLRAITRADLALIIGR